MTMSATTRIAAAIITIMTTMMTRMSMNIITIIMTTMTRTSTNTIITMMTMSVTIPTAAATITMMRTASTTIITTITTADEVFVSWGEETHKKFTKAEIESCLKALEDAEKYGMVLRCKGYVANAEGGKWIHFDYVPGEPDIREGGAMVTGRICVIGSKLNEQAVAELFGTAH